MVFQRLPQTLGTLGLDRVSSTQWTHIVKRIAPFGKKLTDWNVQQARTEAIRCGDESSLHIQFGGFYLTRGHYSKNTHTEVTLAAWPTMLRHQADEN